MTFQKLIQLISLSFFVILLYIAAFPYMEGQAVDLFLRMDPIAAVTVMLSSRAFLWEMIPGIIVLISAFLFGRVFCGYVCPFGSTLDFVSRFISGKKKHDKPSTFESNKQRRNIKYIFLSAVLAAAMVGISLVHYGSPLSLITRIYSLVFYPLLMTTWDGLLQVGAPVLNVIGFDSILYLDYQKPVFNTNGIVALFFVGMVALTLYVPRFWCRYLCPAGALLGLFARKPIIGRSVGDSCTSCGKCARQCPMGAIPLDNPANTAKSECIVCLHCKNVCPTAAVEFTRTTTRKILGTDLTRRGVLFGIGSGLIAAGVAKTGLDSIAAKPEGKSLVTKELVRPPGAIKEPDFLDKCIRCGECMKACATNGLQPIWFSAGLEGLFSPALIPRLGACATNCNVCGQVCPTGAIRRLPLIEKNHAKIGTASINKRACLVWEHDKKCLVCDEVCPYNAVAFRPVPGLKNPAPVVEEKRCSGCGWCENKCPVAGVSAIRVESIAEIRINDGSYIEKAGQDGLIFKQKNKLREETVPGMFDSDAEIPQESQSSLPQGFTDK